MTLGDRLVVMHQGRAAQVASPMEVWAKPADTYVASFIGSPSMNLLPATLLEGGAGARLASGQEILFADGPRPGAAGMPLTLGLRPEHVLVGDAPDALPLTVDLVEPLGSETVVHGRLPDGVPITVRVNGPFTGSSLPALLDPRELHVFDGGTGKRLETG